MKFQNDGWGALKYYREEKNPKVVEYVIRYSGGYVKDEKQASYVILGFVIIAITISAFLFFGAGKSTKDLQPSNSMMRYFPPSN